jgi:pyruvate dehydrogenase E2 component (dihydrolipoamide acetyltransferase)
VVAVASKEEGIACAARLFARPFWQVERIGAILHAQAADKARRAALERITEQSFAAASHFPPPDWSALPIPVQAIWGREDRIIPVPPRSLLPPDAPFHVFDKTGHLPHSEAATPTTAALRDFLKLHDPS